VLGFLLLGQGMTGAGRELAGQEGTVIVGDLIVGFLALEVVGLLLWAYATKAARAGSAVARPFPLGMSLLYQARCPKILRGK
jgi:hypothetical protein